MGEIDKISLEKDNENGIVYLASFVPYGLWHVNEEKGVMDVKVVEMEITNYKKGNIVEVD